MSRIKSQKQSIKLMKEKSEKEKKGRTYSKLKIKHLSSMTNNWKRIRMKVKMAARLNTINKNLQQEIQLRKSQNTNEELTLTEAQELHIAAKDEVEREDAEIDTAMETLAAQDADPVHAGGAGAATAQGLDSPTGHGTEPRIEKVISQRTGKV